MILGFRRMLPAVPALVAGMAFFFAGCEPRVAVKPIEAKKVQADLFDQAESYRRAGELDLALATYRRSVQQQPEGARAPVALHRIADIHSERGDYEKSAETLEEILAAYPDYAELPVVHYQLVETLYRLEDFARSRAEAERWLDRYGKHSLSGDILVLLGQDLLILGDRPGAFLWWLKAKEEGLVDPATRDRLHEDLSELIRTSGIESLKGMSVYAADTEYASPIYYRIALLSIDKGEWVGAREAASVLVRSSKDPHWIEEGRNLLERITEQMSVRRNVIGCLLPLTGPFAIYGQEVLNGIQLGMGLLQEPDEGPELELVVRDTRGELEYALVGLEELVRYEKVMAVIGPLSSKTAPAVAGRAQALGVPIITLTQKPDITGTGEMVFRNFLTPSQEIRTLLETAVDELGIYRFGILYPDNSYGRFLTHLFWDGVEKRGGEITAVESYAPDGTDFEEQIKKMVGLYYPRPAWVDEKLRQMKAAAEQRATEGSDGEASAEESPPASEEPEPIIDFEAVFMPDNFQRVAMIAPQLVYHDVLNVRLLGTSLWQSPQLVELAGDYVHGAIFPSGFFSASGDPAVTAFVQEYRANFNDAPGILAASGYDTIRLLKTKLAVPECATRRDLQKRLLSEDGPQGVTGDLSFDEIGEVRKKPLMLVVSGREIKVLPHEELQYGD